MDTAWEFVKRHKTKIATAATFVGGIYATKKVLDYHGYQTSDFINKFTHKDGRDPMIQV
jgi:hypothetical protein